MLRCVYLADGSVCGAFADGTCVVLAPDGASLTSLVPAESTVEVGRASSRYCLSRWRTHAAQLSRFRNAFAERPFVAKRTLCAADEALGGVLF